MENIYQQFHQSDAIRDHVFPIVDTGRGKVEFLGTGFIIGQRNFALTAGHVIKDALEPAALFVVEGGWLPFSICAQESHPHEDLALLELNPPTAETNWTTFFSFNQRDTRSSLTYHLWGYPEDAAIELLSLGQGIRPDLVYSTGHVRRRLSGVPLPSIRGSQFIEVSEVAGAGCSGSPLFTSFGNSNWDLCAVYVGERVNDRSTSVGYAIVLDQIAEWVPELLGHPLEKELNNPHPRWSTPL